MTVLSHPMDGIFHHLPSCTDVPLGKDVDEVSCRFEVVSSPKCKTPTSRQRLLWECAPGQKRTFGSGANCEAGEVRL